jgi:hypothetical protein
MDMQDDGLDVLMNVAHFLECVLKI